MFSDTRQILLDIEKELPSPTSTVNLLKREVMVSWGSITWMIIDSLTSDDRTLAHKPQTFAILSLGACIVAIEFQLAIESKEKSKQVYDVLDICLDYATRNRRKQFDIAWWVPGFFFRQTLKESIVEDLVWYEKAHESSLERVFANDSKAPRPIGIEMFKFFLERCFQRPIPRLLVEEKAIELATKYQKHLEVSLKAFKIWHDVHTQLGEDLNKES